MAIVRLGGLSRRLGGRATHSSVASRGRSLSGAAGVRLQVHSSGRYITDNGAPLLLVADSPWSIASTLTNSQIDSYLNDRQAKGCNCIIWEAISRTNAHNAPNNADGVAPFTGMSPVNWVINDTYWQRVDYVVNQAKAKGMVCIINPAYHGVGDGWIDDYSGVSNTVLQDYGAALANRYTQGNIIWCMGGDGAGDSGATGNYGAGNVPNRTKQWQIVLGMRTVRTTDLITGHTARNGATGAVNGEAWKAWTTGYTGFNLNNTYGHVGVDDMPALADAAWGRSGYPFMEFEAGYEGNDGSMGSMLIPAMQGFLRGALVGVAGGHDTLWHFGANSAQSAATTLSLYLAGSWDEMGWLKTLLTSYAWHLYEPKTDTSLVTTSLGTGADTICPGRASDGSSAMIFQPQNAAFTVAMTALTPSSVRCRWWDYRTGNFSSAGGPFANTGTRSFTPPGFNYVLVLDANP